MTTMGKVVENGIVFVKNKITNKIELMATSASFQVGMKDYPGDLILNGDLCLSSRDVKLPSSSGKYTIPNDSTITNISTDSVSGTIYVNLPSSPRNGQIACIKDASGTCSAVNIIISSHDGSLIDGSTNKVLDSDHSSCAFIWIGNRWSTLFASLQSSERSYAALQFSAGSIVNDVNRYLFPGYSTSAASTSLVEIIAADDYVLKNLFIKQTPGLYGEITYTVVVNGVDTALSKSIMFTDSTGNNVTDKVNISKGDLITVKVYNDTFSEVHTLPTNLNVSFMG